MKKVVVFFLSVIIFSPILAQKDLGPLPFEINEKWLIVNYAKNGIKTNLIFDSGAIGSVLDNSVFESLGGKKIGAGVRIKFGANYKESSIALVPALSSIKDVWQTVYGFKDIQRQEKKADGIIGADQLINDFVVEFNFAKKQIFLHDTASYTYSFSSKTKVVNLYLGNRNGSSIRKNIIGVRPIVMVSLKFKDTLLTNVPMLLDTGFFDDIGLLVRDNKVLKRLSDGYRNVESAFVGNITDVGYADLKYKLDCLLESNSVEAKLFLDYGLIATFGDCDIAGLIGLSFFKKFKIVVLDNNNGKLYLEEW